MSKKLKFFSLAMAMLLVLALFASCGTTDDPEVTQTPTVAPSEEPSEEPAPEPGTPALPLTDEPVTFSWFFPIPQEKVATLGGDWGGSEGYKELARRTGVEIKFVSPTVGMDAEQFNLMITGGDYTDLINNASYIGGLDKAVEDGVYLEISELVDKFAPNYKNWLDNYPGMKRDSRTDKGNMVGFYQLNTLKGKSRPWGGFYIRQDWLDDLGMNAPVTYDDWYNTLTAFKNEKGADAALFLPNTGYYTTSELLSGYQVGFNLYQVDRVVKYGPMETGFKEYLMMLNKWYEEGLVSPDFMTNQSMFYMPDTSYTTTGRSGIFWNVYLSDLLTMMSGNPDYKLSAILAPVKNVGDKLHFGGPAGADDVATGPTVAITSTCADPELAARWADYQYSPEGFILSNWGIEGKSFEIVDGEPRFLEEIEGEPFADAKAKWVYMYGPTVYDFDIEYTTLTDAQFAATEVWGQVDYDYGLPAVSLTTEEGDRNSMILNEINTYVSEMILKFITGGESFDNYDDFVNRIKEMGIDEVLEIQQNALDRYYAR